MEKLMENVPGGVVLPEDEAYLAEVADLLENETVQSMANYVQHGVTSCLQHCISVSYRSWCSCKRYGLDARAAARGGLLHDLFLYDWHKHKPAAGEAMHGFTHARTALENAEKEFDLTEVEREIILKHMWPLTLNPPKYKEAYIVVWHDKACSLRETFGLNCAGSLQKNEQ